MNHLYLIDSSVWIRILRSRPNEETAQRVRELIQRGRAATNGLIRLEIMAGARDERSFEIYRDRLAALVYLTVSEATWDVAAELGFRLRRRGLTVGSPDLVIAASAIEHNAVLVHADADFDRIAADSPLRVESYAETSN